MDHSAIECGHLMPKLLLDAVIQWL